MRSCEGMEVKSAWAYARRSGGICELCRIPTYNPKNKQTALISTKNGRI